MDLDNFLDTAHADARERMKIEEDKMFLKCSYTDRENRVVRVCYRE